MKKVLALALAAAMMLSLAACGRGKDDEKVNSGDNQSTVGQQNAVQPQSGTDAPTNRVDDGAPASDGSQDEDYGGNAADIGGDEDFSINDDQVDGTESDKGPRPLTKDSLAGEKYIADEFFGVSDLTTDEVRARIGEEVAETIGESAVADLRLIINMYSIEGVHRDLEYANEEYDHARRAMVVACWMFGVPYDELFDNGYMTKDEAQPIIDVLATASQG